MRNRELVVGVSSAVAGVLVTVAGAVLFWPDSPATSGPAPVAARVTAALSIPTIGIGAGVDCDGQVLVWHDLLGLYEGRTARFVKRYAEVGDVIRTALEAFAADVRERRFPEERHTYAMPEDELAVFERAVQTGSTEAPTRT